MASRAPLAVPARPRSWTVATLWLGSKIRTSGRGRFSSRTIRMGLAPREEKELLGVLAVDGGEHLEELVERISVVEVIEQGLCRYAARAKDKRAAHYRRVRSHRAT